MSLWKSDQWTDRNFRTCGQPETGPVFPSTKATGPAGIDAEYRFGVLTSARVCPDMPLRLPNFQMSAGGAYGHPAPLASSVAANHRYQYPLLGTGAPASFRFEDPAGKDNYGDFRITVRDAVAADCANGGAAALGFASEAACRGEVPATAAASPAQAAIPARLDASLAGAVNAAAARTCSSRRSFSIRIRERASRKIRSAKVYVAGKKVGVSRRSSDGRLSARVTLRRQPKGTFTVKIQVTYRDGAKGSYTRRYRTCTSKQKAANGLKSPSAL
jgi:hypothetical protein